MSSTGAFAIRSQLPVSNANSGVQNSIVPSTGSQMLILELGTQMTIPVGETYGKLRVLAQAPNYYKPGSGRSETRWVTLCECGTLSVKFAKYLRNGMTTTCGDRQLHPRRRLLENPTYEGMHYRVRSWKGKASSWNCTDCNGPADEWSYDHMDSDQRWERVTDGKGNAYEVPFSVDIDHYQPRCRSCHYWFDRDNAKKRMVNA
jgi:hypothetical protein